MQRLTRAEMGGLALGIVFIAFGLFAVIRPQETLVFHPGPEKYRAVPGTHRPELLSRSDSQKYGGGIALFGAGIVWLSLYRGKK